MDDAALVVRLRSGDEAAFALLVARHEQWLLRLAETRVGNRAVAEEVVQDTWLAVFVGIHRFERRSSLKTWIARILLNRARSTLARERRCLAMRTEDLDRLTTPPAWAGPVTPWTDDVDDRVAAHQLMGTVREVLPRLPTAQRDVIVLRDIQRARPTEVHARLGLSVANQRVLLHRARTSLRRHLVPQLG